MLEGDIANFDGLEELGDDWARGGHGVAGVLDGGSAFIGIWFGEVCVAIMYYLQRGDG